ncbi:MAG: hypothetical protein R6T93_09855 [Trueperaceae bacterium]
MNHLAPRALVLSAALLLAFAAAQPLVSLPIEDVVGGPIAMSEVTPTSATLLVSTHVDLACVVVFGTDDGFGQLALDADMGGGAHRDHRVSLRGLQPDTEYLYRLQGSDPEGTFYASEVLRFRTPPADGGPSLGVDVATTAAGYDFAATGRGQEFTFRVVGSSGGNTGVVELAVYTRSR